MCSIVVGWWHPWLIPNEDDMNGVLYIEFHYFIESCFLIICDDLDLNFMYLLAFKLVYQCPGALVETDDWSHVILRIKWEQRSMFTRADTVTWTTDISLESWWEVACYKVLERVRLSCHCWYMFMSSITIQRYSIKILSGPWIFPA